MKKIFLLSLLLLFSSGLWSQANARVKSVHGVKTTVNADKVYVPNWDEQLILADQVNNEGTGMVLSNAYSSADGSHRFGRQRRKYLLPYFMEHGF